MAIYVKSSLSKNKRKYLLNNLLTLKKDNILCYLTGELHQMAYFFLILKKNNDYRNSICFGLKEIY
jgi:hypothetical protein